MALPFTTLDVFTLQRFGGNPLAVVRVPASQSVSREQKQLIAREFAFSETIFLHDMDPVKREVEASIFTPHAELPFAGHPVIGAGFHLLSTTTDSNDSTVSGSQKVTLLLPAGRLEIKKAGVGVCASVPHDVHLHKKTLRDVVDGAKRKLAGTASGGGGDRDIERAELDAPVYSIVKGMTVLLANVGPDVNALKKVQPGIPLDDAVLDVVEDEGPWAGRHVGRYFYALTQPETFDDESVATTPVQTRMVTGGGVEDPATGSAACALAAFLTQKRKRVGTSRYEITQGVEMGRRSLITVEVVARAKAKDAGEGVDLVAVHLGGSAIEVMRGEISL